MSEKNEDNIHTSDLHSELTLVQHLLYNTLFLQIPLCFMALSCEMSDPASQVCTILSLELSMIIIIYTQLSEYCEE